MLVKFSEEDCLLRDKSHQSKTKQNKLHFVHLSKMRVKAWHKLFHQGP